MKKSGLLMFLCILYIMALSSCSSDNAAVKEYYNGSNVQLYYGNLAASHKYTADSEGIYYCENNAVYYISTENIENPKCILTGNDEFPEPDNIFGYNSDLYLCNQEDNSFWRYHIENELLEKIDITLPDDHLICHYFVADHTLFVMYAYWEGIACIDLKTSEITHYEDVWGQVSYIDGKIYILNDTLTVIDMADNSVYEVDLASDNTEMYDPVKLYVSPQDYTYLVMEDRSTRNDLLFLHDKGNWYQIEGNIDADLFLFEHSGKIYYTADSLVYSFDMETRDIHQIMQEPKGYIFQAGDYLCAEEGEEITIYKLER